MGWDLEKRRWVESLETRRKILELIQKFPGVHFRALQRYSGLATGQLEYHLKLLEDVDLIRRERDGKFVRFFPNENIDESYADVLRYVYNEVDRKIFLALLHLHEADIKTLARYLERSESTVSRHLNKLVRAGILEKAYRNRHAVFRLKDPKKVIAALTTYRESVLDTLISRFVELWESL